MAQKLQVNKEDLADVLKQIQATAELLKIKQNIVAEERRVVELAERSKWELLPHQMPPKDNDWNLWIMLAGRGVGKTFSLAHYVDGYARDNSDARIAIIAVNQQEAVDVCVNGESGLKKFNKDIRVRVEVGGTHIRWPNGAQARVFGASTIEEVDKIRGQNFSLVWADEIAAWKQLQYAWEMFSMALRIDIENKNEWPRTVASTTPRKSKFLKDLLAMTGTRRSLPAKTSDAKFLNDRARQNLIDLYGGTRLGRQELDGEMLEDVDGALWKSEWIDGARIKFRPDGKSVQDNKTFQDYFDSMKRIVVAVDPAVTAKKPTDRDLKLNKTSDYTGICVAGLGEDGDFYIFDLFGAQETPAEWAKTVVDTYYRWEADKIIAEVNNGGDLIELNLRTVDRNLPIKTIHAFKGKSLRAEPIAALYEKKRVHHLGTFSDGEDEMVVFPMEPSAHDDMVDALVYALTELQGRGGFGVRFING